MPVPVLKGFLAKQVKEEEPIRKVANPNCLEKDYKTRGSGVLHFYMCTFDTSVLVLMQYHVRSL